MQNWRLLWEPRGAWSGHVTQNGGPELLQELKCGRQIRRAIQAEAWNQPSEVREFGDQTISGIFSRFSSKFYIHLIKFYHFLIV